MRVMLGEEAYAAGEELARQEHLRVISQSASQTRFLVTDGASHTVTIAPGTAATCTCEEMSRLGVCRHLAAAMLYAKKNGSLDELLHRQAGDAAMSLLGAMDAGLPQESPVKL